MYSRETPEQVFSRYDNMLRSIVNKYFWFETPKYSKEDMLQEARSATLDSIIAWDDEKGKNVKFSTYLYKRVSGHLKKWKKINTYDIKITEYKFNKDFKAGALSTSRFPKDHGGVVGKNTKMFSQSDAMALRLDSPINQARSSKDGGAETMSDIIPSGSLPPDIQLLKKEQLEILREEINSLGERERYVISARWLDRRKFEDIAYDMGLRKQTVHSIEKKARHKLGNRVRKKLIEMTE